MNTTKSVIFIIVSLLLISCAAEENVLSARANLHKVLALGDMISLNSQPTNWEKDLLVRLYEVPIFENNCFIETHGICQNEYYLTVSTFDEYPELNVYKLEFTGELIDYQWIEEATSDYVEILFVMRNYRSDAIKNNPKLKGQNFRFIIKVSAEKLEMFSD